ncbi:MAG TPA: CRISPR-associated endonuclease Cas2 [Thermoguttaceae bacterium]|nr:CRISPR-associated endonuclease Cas2 [Thermoguttaceae bacterium]
MWLFAMFDLPTDTKKAKKQYVEFRRLLLEEGFSMLQYSVYARYCASEEHSTAHRRRIHASLPPDGHIRLVAITDRQFGKMEIFYGKKRDPAEEAPQQLMLF